MSLRYDGTCSTCRSTVPARSKAWWDSATKQVTCLTCAPAQRQTSVAEPPGVVRAPLATSPAFPPPPTIDHGIGGISANKEYERRVAKHAKQIEGKWGTGRIGRFVKFMSDEPQSTDAWAKGAEGERRLARRLTGDLSDVAIVLHDRKVPKTRGNIDHLVVASNGIWIVDAKNYTGKAEQRDVGGLFSTNVQLYVNGRNQTELISGLEWQVHAVRAALTPTGFAEMPVHPTLCFLNSGGLFAKPFHLDDVLVTWPTKLLESIRAPGPFDAITRDMLARELSSKLPASS